MTSYGVTGKHHPDCIGDTAAMRAINVEYAYAYARPSKAKNLSTEETTGRIRLSEEYRQVLEHIIHLPNIIIELVGHWIWVTGNDKKKSHNYFAVTALFYGMPGIKLLQIFSFAPITNSCANKKAVTIFKS